MEGIIGLFLLIIFMVGFMRIDSNVIKITKSLEVIEKELTMSGKEKK